MSLEYDGKQWSYHALADHAGMSEQLLWDRINRRGMSVAEAVETPVRGYRQGPHAAPRYTKIRYKRRRHTP